MSTHQFGASDLPQEITDYILQFLAGDSRSLAACSLACKSWSVMSSRLLFRTIALRIDTVAPLYSVLYAPRTRVHVNVVTLKIEARLGRFRPRTDRELPVIGFEILLRSIATFRRLKHLSLDGITLISYGLQPILHHRLHPIYWHRTG